jgi:hypothetical protein
MATLSTAQVCDNSTLAHFKAWAQTISNFMATAGWTQSTDTGQVNWGTIAAVPTNSYVYEIWQPGDGLTTFYFKIEYGYSSTIPQMRISIGTSTNGAGTLSGFIAGPFYCPGTSLGGGASNQGATTYNCYLSGNSGRIGIAMWVNNTVSPSNCYFGVARSKNSSGANTSTHVTLLTTSGNRVGVQTIVFGTGVTTTIGQGNAYPPVIHTGLPSNIFASTDVPISPLFPCVGYYDNPLIELGAAAANDITDQATFTISAANTPYGVSHTYIGFKLGQFLNWCDEGQLGNAALVMIYE